MLKVADLSQETERSTTELAWSLLAPPVGAVSNRQRYLDLMKLALTDLLYEVDAPWRRRLVEGWDWPRRAHTMIGLHRLNNLERCVEHVLTRGIPGDLIETGVWRGGAAIFMRALLAAHEDPARVVWVADSFAGMPKPDAARHPADKDLDLSAFDELRVSVAEVERNFTRYGLLDERVRFLPGWFRDTLPRAPIARLAILRLDGDLYGSTWDVLENLYPKVSPGGCVIVDDHWFPACRQAMEDYRRAHGITDEVVPIDTQGAYWIKS
jgi:hypothetical protein